MVELDTLRRVAVVYARDERGQAIDGMISVETNPSTVDSLPSRVEVEREMLDDVADDDGRSTMVTARDASSARAGNAAARKGELGQSFRLLAKEMFRYAVEQSSPLDHARKNCVPHSRCIRACNRPHSSWGPGDTFGRISVWDRSN